MVLRKPKFTLECDAHLTEFILRSDGEEWSKSFSTTIAAIQHAATLVKQEAELTVYNERKKVLLVTSVYPAQ